MAVRIRYEFTSDYSGTEWRCDIDDKNYGGSINIADGNGFDLRYERDGDKFLEPIKGSACTLRLFDNDESFWSAFDTNLAASFEQEFTLVIYKNSSLYWVGNVLPESALRQNESGRREYVIEAVDGLARLKDVYFTAAVDNTLATAGAGFRAPQAYAILWQLLEYTGHRSFWGTDDNYIKYFGYYTANANTSYYELLDRTRVPLRIFTDENDDIARKNQTPIKAYDALRKLLSLFNLRLILSNGSWYVYHIATLQNTSLKTGYYCYYKKSGTPSATNPFRYNYDRGSQANAGSFGGEFAQFDGNNLLDPLAGGQFGYFPALTRAEINAPSAGYAYGDIQSRFASQLLDSSTAPMSETVQLGVIEGATGRQLSFSFSLDLKYAGTVVLAALRSRWKLRIRVKVIAGSYRLFDPGSKADNMSWTTGTPSHSVYIDTQIQDRVQYTLITPDIPWASEDVQVDYTFDIIDSAGTSIGVSTFAYNIRYVGIAALSGGNPIENTRYLINNPNITLPPENSVAEILPDYPLDNTGRFVFGNCLTFNTASTTYDAIDTWGANHSSNLTPAATLLQDVMALQDNPRRRYYGAFSDDTGAWLPFMVFDYDQTRWTMNAVRYNAKDDEWNGEWFGLQWYAQGLIATPETGRGIHYDGVDTVKPTGRILPPWEWGGDVKDVFYKERIGGSGAALGDTISSITIQSASESLLKSGDVVAVFDPDTNEKLGELTLTADVDASDTSMAFSSATLAKNIPAGAYFLIRGQDGLATPMLRTNELQLKPPATVTAASGDTILIFDSSDSNRLKKINYTAPVDKVSGFGADSGFGTVLISAASTYYVTNQGAWNSSKLSSGITYNTSTNLYTNNTGRTLRLLMQAQLEVFSFAGGAESSYNVSLAIGIDAGIGGGQTQDKVILNDAKDIISVFYVDDITNGQTFGVYIANKTNNDDIEWARIRFAFQEL